MFEIFLNQRRQGRPWRRQDTMALSVGVHVLLLLGAAHVPIHTQLTELRSPRPAETVTFLRVLDRQEHTVPPARSEPAGPSAPSAASAPELVRSAERPEPAVATSLLTVAPEPPAGLPELAPSDHLVSSLLPAGSGPPVRLASGLLPGRGSGSGPGASPAARRAADISAVAEIPVLQNQREMQRVWRRLYPDVLNRRGIEGEAVVSFVIGTDGRVEPGTVQLVSASHPALGDATVESVARMRYRPARLDGRSVAVRVTLPIHWRIHAE